MLFDYDQICKKILQSYKFVTSGKHNIRLALLNFYGKQRTVKIPILSPKNWTTLVADMLERTSRLSGWRWRGWGSCGRRGRGSRRRQWSSTVTVRSSQRRIIT